MISTPLWEKFPSGGGGDGEEMGVLPPRAGQAGQPISATVTAELIVQIRKRVL